MARGSRGETANIRDRTSKRFVLLAAMVDDRRFDHRLLQSRSSATPSAVVAEVDSCSRAAAAAAELEVAEEEVGHRIGCTRSTRATVQNSPIRLRGVVPRAVFVALFLLLLLQPSLSGRRGFPVGSHVRRGQPRRCPCSPRSRHDHHSLADRVARCDRLHHHDGEGSNCLEARSQARQSAPVRTLVRRRTGRRPRRRQTRSSDDTKHTCTTSTGFLAVEEEAVDNKARARRWFRRLLLRTAKAKTRWRLTRGRVRSRFGTRIERRPPCPRPRRPPMTDEMSLSSKIGFEVVRSRRESERAVSNSLEYRVRSCHSLFSFDDGDPSRRCLLHRLRGARGQIRERPSDSRGCGAWSGSKRA